MNFNIAIIAGYDVLANKISAHGDYVAAAFSQSILLDADLIIFVGGATNPDYPDKTEARANSLNLCTVSIAEAYEIREIEDSEKGKELITLLEVSRSINQRRADWFCNGISKSKERIFSLIKALPIGNTSAETLEATRCFIKENKIPVGRLILCAEQSRITGFMLDALMIGLFDLSQEIFCYGHPFPESKQGFDSQRKKMLLKVLSHRSAFFRKLREFGQKIHQRKVARIKRKGSNHCTLFP